MTIETQFSRGDEVYYMGSNQVVKDLITQIKIMVNINGLICVYYSCDRRVPAPEQTFMIEDRVFASKEKLLKSL